YLTMYATPVDRAHVFSLCALSGQMPLRERRWWAFYFRIWAFTHNTVFIGQDHRVLRHTELGPELLSAWDRDVVTWRRFAVQHARGCLAENAPDDSPELEDAADEPTNGHAPGAADAQGLDGRDAARATATEAAIS